MWPQNAAHVDVYTADQMRAYALAAVEAVLAAEGKDAERLRAALINLLREAPSADTLNKLARDDGVLNRRYPLTTTDGALLEAHAALQAGGRSET
jgi:hypothetical protein